MAAPRLRLRRGTDNPVDLTGVGQVFESGSATQALVGEPLFVDTNGAVPTSEGNGGGDFYIADGGSSFVHIGGSSYTARVDSFLVDQIPTDNTGVSAGAKVILEEGGPNPETITIQAPVQDDATNSYTMFLPVGAPTTAGQYLIEYDQATSQLSFVDQVASEQLTTRQAPEDTDATADVYYPTFVANNNADPGALENFYTEGQLTFLPDKDGNAAGTISSLQITGEYVASTGYFSGTGSTDTASVTTNFATEPTASGNTKEVNVGTGAAAGSTTNINIGSAVAGTTEFLGTDNNTLGNVTSGAVQMDGGAAVAGNVTIGGDLAVEGGNIVADPDNTGNAAALYDTSTGTVNIGGASATLNLGNDGTGATTVNIATGATATGTTKTVNIATSGAADSTTAVNIGSASEPDQTTVTIFGNLTVQGTQTITNINTTNTNVSDRLLGLATGATSAAATEDSGLIIERGTTGDNVFIGFDEDNDVFVTGLTTETSASATAGTITPVTFLAKQLNITDDAGTNESVIRYFTAADANTEFGVSDAVAERYIHNVVIDGGVF